MTLGLIIPFVMHQGTLISLKPFSLALMLSSMTQANESEIPLLHEFNDVAKDNETSIEVIFCSCAGHCLSLSFVFINFFIAEVNYTFSFGS